MTNRLAHETSPYLRQHVDNPVDWYAWGDEAFAAAHERDVPLFVSVGYSSCHWCHVMAHESFEDTATADVMNRLFVNVKVDREERPDVDAIYMQSVQALTGRGGWPMSVWCTPDGRPFYAGTYFPNDDRHGMPAFTKVCDAVAEAWRERREEVVQQSDQLTAAIAEDILQPERAGALSPDILERAYGVVRNQFEPRFGGFGTAPKFPQAMTIDFLCRALVRNHADDTRTMITTTLDRMAAGGIYDQLGGGFARYSTDDFWLVPHFEKMLYDNALLTRAYLHGYLVTGDERYRRVVEETIEYVCRDLRHPDGGFFSAEDADSEGVEGKFYCWSLSELREVCGADADAVIAHFGVTEQGNFVDPHTQFRGNILHLVDPHAVEPEAVTRAKHALLARRSTRIRPGLDDKVLLAWNTLMLSSLAEAAAVLERSDWMETARTNATFLLPRAPAARRPVPPVLAGAAPRLRGGLRRAPRSALHDGRGRRRIMAHGGAQRGRRAPALVSRPGRRRVLHERERRRAARRPPEGCLRRCDPFGELARGQRTAAPRRAHRRSAVPRACGRACWSCSSVR